MPDHATGVRAAARALDILMATLFGLATVVQLNDPDPLRWVAIYGAACVLCIIALTRGPAPPLVFLAAAAVAVVWASMIVISGPGPSGYRHMFDAWEMKSIDVEQAREASGLLLVAGWMALLGLRAMRRSAARAGRVG